jgi:hypothetical protein
MAGTYLALSARTVAAAKASMLLERREPMGFC